VLILLAAILLAIFVLDRPWDIVVVVAAVAIEIGEATVFIWWSQRRKATVGAETLVGETAVVVQELRPEGRVRLQGELWRARCDDGAAVAVGAQVRVRALDGLTLEVEQP
jgi:membrane protein implicated in regulation of membrane protease activity